MDAQERNSDVILLHSLIPEVIVDHSTQGAARIGDRDPQLSLLRPVHSVVNLMLVYAE